MNTTLRAAIAALSLIAATAAHAASGGVAPGGAADPFPFHAPGIIAVNPPAYADAGSTAYPDLAGRPSQVVIASSAEGVPLTGSQGGVETTNSLPRGFREGTVAYAQAQSVQRYVAAQAAQRHAAAQAAQSSRAVQTAQVLGGKPRG